MGERVLTQRELNRATLARQLLLERARLPLGRAVERVAGLQAQLGSAPYVGLWTRLDGFERSALERALRSGRLVRAVLMRGTVHLVSRRDHGVFGAAVGLPPWVRPESAALAERVRHALREFARVPRTRAEVLEWLNEEHGLEHDGGAGLWYALRMVGRLTHAPETGFWKPPRGTTHVALEHEEVDTQAARAELVRRYLRAFGPATRADIAEWSGLRVRDFAAGLEALGPLRRFADERGRELLDLGRAPLPSPETPAPARLLPRLRQPRPLARRPDTRDRG